MRERIPNGAGGRGDSAGKINHREHSLGSLARNPNQKPETRKQK
jgi:hypothetical protein